MAATLTPSRHDTPFSFSQSQSRPYGPETSIADTLPSIDFNFAELRERMAIFTAKFDDFIDRGRKRVLEERNAFRLNIAELQESQRATQSSLTTLSTQSTTHADTLARETAELTDLQTSISTLTSDRAAASANRDALLSRIAATQSSIAALRSAAAQRARHREAQSRLNGPELRFWESSLGMRIEGAGAAERLRFVFGDLNGQQRGGGAGREGSFVLDMRREEYAVVETEPGLEEEGVAEVVGRLNSGGELREFLRGMRGLVVRGLREG